MVVIVDGSPLAIADVVAVAHREADVEVGPDLARRMVTEWGMSETLGRLRYSENEEQLFLGRSIAKTQNVSDDTARLIDARR